MGIDLVALVAPGVVLAVPGAVFVVACVPFALRRLHMTVAVESNRSDRLLSHPGLSSSAQPR